MKNKKYYIALNDREYAEIISSLISAIKGATEFGAAVAALVQFATVFI